MQEKKADVGYSIGELEYSKKLSRCASGEIVAHRETKHLLLNVPWLAEKDWQLFCTILDELKHLNITVGTKTDIYFFLKNYCLEHLLLLTKNQREDIMLLLEWEALGESILTLFLKDPDFEEVVINGAHKPIMAYHATFGWLSSNANFTSEEKIRNVLNKMAAPLGRQLSFHSPILNAVLKDGSRLNAAMNPIAFSGINATIRKFKENPLTPIDIVEYRTISREAMAFLWMTMQTSSSILDVCGHYGARESCNLFPRTKILGKKESPQITFCVE